jgi:cbb3-type cytochrome oxidase subunit 3
MISGIFTAVLIVLFLGVTAWAYSSRQKARFEEAQALPLVEDTYAEGDEA